MTRTQAKASKQKPDQLRKISFFTSYNPSLPCMNTLIKKHLPLLHSEDNWKTLFPIETCNFAYRKNKELFTPSLFPTPKREKYCYVASCNTCKTCKNYMVFSSTFACAVTGRNCYIRGNFKWNSTNVVYLIECINCKCQYFGPITSFKQCFPIHKSDIKTKKDCCGTGRHFNANCCHTINPHGYLKVQLIEQVFCDSCKDIESILWKREKYWQCQLFTNTHGMNSISDLYRRSRKGCRKK